MAVKATDTILGSSRGTAAAAIAYARAHGAKRPLEVESYINEVYRLAPLVGIDASVVVAQSSHETDVWRSYYWEQRLNPAGLAITGDAVQNAASRTWKTGMDAARSHLAHMLLYTISPTNAGIRWSHIPNIDRQVWQADPRYYAYFEAYGDTVQATIIEDLDGKWAADTSYASGIVRHATAIFGDVPDQESGDDTVPTKPTLIIDAGHRSTDRSGNPAEMALTDDMANAYVTEARARGYTANWYQRDLDKDSDPDETIGDLNTVALGIGRLIVNTPGPIVFLSLHYNGSNSPLHAIVPDNRGLTTAYAGGAPGDDTMANNVLDVQLGKQIMQIFARAGLGTLYHGDGIMSETETGVGLDGFRLAVFAATVSGRDRTVRLVIEHGGVNDAAARQNDFTDRCAKAAMDAIDTVYKQDGQPAPVPVPTPKFATPSKPNWWEAAKKLPYPKNFDFNGTRFVGFRALMTVTKPTVQRATASMENSKSAGVDLPKGTTVNCEGVFKVGKTKWILASGSGIVADCARVPLRDLSLNVTVAERAA